MADFIIVQAEGKSFLGKPQAGWQALLVAAQASGAGLLVEPRLPLLELSPVYEYSLQLVNGPRGPMVQPDLRPPFGCMSIRRLAIPGARPWVAVADLSADEQRVFEQLVEMTEASMLVARAQAAGVAVIPPTPTAMPTRFGGGPRR